MLRVVLPVAALAIDVAVEIVVTIEIVIVIDIDVAAVPIAIAPVVGPCGSQNESGSEGQPRTGVVSRIGVRIIGIGRRSSPINDLRII